MKNKELYWSARKGLWEWTLDDQAEVAARIAEVKAAKEARGQIAQEYNVEAQRQATSIYRCRSNGARQKHNSLFRNY